MAEQGPPPPGSDRPPSRRHSRRAEADYPAEDEDLPPWAGLAIDPRWADGRGKRRRPEPAPPAAPEPARRPSSPREADPYRSARPGPAAPGRYRTGSAGAGQHGTSDYGSSDYGSSDYGTGGYGAGEYGAGAAGTDPFRADLYTDPYRPAAPDPGSPGAAPSGTDRKGTDPSGTGLTGTGLRGTGPLASDPFQPERYRPERRGADAERGTAQRRAPAHSAGPYETGPYDTGRYGAGPYDTGSADTGPRGSNPRRGRSQSADPFADPFEDDADGAGGSPSLGDKPARPEGRQAAARARRTRRSIHRWGLALAGAAVLGVGGWLLFGRSSPPAQQPNPIVTSFQPGEFQAVPNACTAVSSGTLSQYLPGKRTVAAPASLDGGSASLCSWTLDAAPVYRLLNVQATAYAPNGLASGDGSATFAAIDGYDQALQQKMNPAKGTRLPKATITRIPHLGSTAFAAYQTTSAAGVTTDLLTVVVRDRNVLVTSVLEGDSGRGGYGPVSVPQLQAGAAAAARDVLARLK